MEKMISVVVPTYSRPNMLKNAIESVLAQTYVNFEILVIDDNGENTQNQILTEKTLKKYIINKQVIYIKHCINKGGNAARNTGIKHAKGEFVAFLDDDDEWKETFLEKMMVKFNNKKIGAVYCKYLIQKSGKQFYLKKGEGLLYSGKVFNRLLQGWCPASTSLFIVRKKCFKEVGGFDECLTSFQDYDMWLRISQEFDFDYVNERLVIKHEGHGGEQVGFNPYNRRKAIIDLKEKWEPKLSICENKEFKIFLKIHDIKIKHNLILYNKEKQIKCNYRKLYLDYLMTEAKLRDKLIILFVILFGTNVIKYKELILGKFLGRYQYIT